MSAVSREAHHRLSGKEVSHYASDMTALRRRADEARVAHERAARRWEYAFYVLAGPIFVASALAGVTGFADNARTAGVAAIAAAALTAVMTLMRPQEHRAHEVRQVLAYNKMAQRCERYDRHLSEVTSAQAERQYQALIDQMDALEQQRIADDVPLPELPR